MASCAAAPLAPARAAPIDPLMRPDVHSGTDRSAVAVAKASCLQIFGDFKLPAGVVMSRIGAWFNCVYAPPTSSAGQRCRSAAVRSACAALV